MALDVEGVVNRRVGDEKSLGQGWEFEPLLMAFSASDRQVEVLNAVLFPKPAGSMTMPQIKLIQSGSRPSVMIISGSTS